MKLFRFGPRGSERPGLLDSMGVRRDLSALIADITPEVLNPLSLANIAKIDPTTLPRVGEQERYGSPLTRVGKFLAIGLNYSEHAAEANMPLPAEPIVFMKATSCIQGPNDPVMLPRDSRKTDWEVELGVVMGSTARYVSEADALKYVAGYLIVNDLSEREYQLERGGTWDKGKGCDTFGPLGPWLVSTDEIQNPQGLDLWLEVNGRRVQSGNTRTMIFGVSKLVSYCSQFMTLCPGDVITTGTPPGVGMGLKPTPRFLQAGDRMRLGISQLGEQSQIVVAYQSSPLE